MKLPIGIDDYKKLIQQSYDHVDKTLFIKAFLDENVETTLITRPRRFGKTINMSMLYYFFSNQHAEENRRLFIGKKIETASTNDGRPCMDFQGQYPVIFLTFKNIRPTSFTEAKEQISFKMAEIYKEYRYLEESDKLHLDEKIYFKKIIEGTGSTVDLQQSLTVLSKYLQRHYDKKVFILLDEYDTPFHTAYTHAMPFHDELTEFMKIFLGSAFKGNLALEKAMITGILRVSLMDLFSGANSISVRSMLVPKYENFFGFTEQETQDLMRTDAADLSEANISSRMNVATKWYNGYRLGTTLLYNPWSLISYIDMDYTPDVYWNASGEDSVLGKSLLNSAFETKDYLVKLLQEETLEIAIDERTVFADPTRNQAALWGLMLYSGYLKVIGDNGELGNKKKYQVAIPNLEVASTLLQITKSRYSTRLQQEGIVNVHHVGIAFCGKEMHMASELHSYPPTSL